MHSSRRSKGFTIVELLIVIVIIGILAAITIVAYNGVQNRAKTSSLQSDLGQAAKQIQVDYSLNGTYPASAAAADGGKGLKAGSGVTLNYTVDNAANPPFYCLSATSSSSGVSTYYVSSGNSMSIGSCGGTGLTGSYWNNYDLSGSPTIQRTDTTVSFPWGAGSPGAGIPNDMFSARWTGFLTPTTTGTYTVSATTDDGVRIWVNNTLIVDAWGTCCSNFAGTIALNSGVTVPIKMEMREGGGAAYAHLYWTPPSGSQVIIPTSALSH